MTTSFDLNQDGIIRNAYQMAGVVAPGDEPDSAQIAFGADILNVRTKALQNEGIILRTVTQQTFPLVQGQANYTLPASTLDVDTGTPYVNNGQSGSAGINVPLEWYSRAQYMALTVPSIQAQPTSIYIEKTTTIAFYLYPVPDGNWPTITLPIISLLGDLSLGNDTSGLQAKYLDTLVLSVAVRLALSFGLPARYQMLKKEYEDAKTLATNDDTQRGSVKFTADYGPSVYGKRVL
jgi:hypothetical protein